MAARTGEKRRGALFLLEVKKRAGDDEMPPRVGFTVTRKNGNAVKRNRIKRRLREAVRTAVVDDLAAGTDYVIVARPESIDVPFDRLAGELRSRIRGRKK